MKNHPCPYSNEILEYFQGLVRPGAMVLDNMAGSGKIHELKNCYTFGVEIEPEWALAHPRNICGDAMNLPFPDDSFDDVFVSCAYANRLADQYLPPDSDTSTRLTYAIRLGRKLSKNSGARYGFNKSYKEIHTAAWADAARVLKSFDSKDRIDGGRSRFILNVKDFYIKGEKQLVTDWHVETLTSLGFQEMFRVELESSGWKLSPHRLRDNEKIIIFDYMN